MLLKTKIRRWNEDYRIEIEFPPGGSRYHRHCSRTMTIAVDRNGTINVPATGDMNPEDIDGLCETLRLAQSIVDGSLSLDLED